MLRFHDDAGGTTRMMTTTLLPGRSRRVTLTAVATALLLGGGITVGPTRPGVDAASTDTASDETLDDTPWVLPETPPRCTRAQADSGDVADCLMVFYNDPSDLGYGVPPAPGVGDGWSWNGYWYNGSTALAEWESEQITSNTATVAGLPVGSLETHRDAAPLFEGFLDEISAKGYRVHAASGYAFRCTSGTGGWSCPSGDPDDLSNHAYGLAIDMNAGTNPIRSYAGLDGETACLTPMTTDMPRWVIQTAEKWGLYWGGYGWNSGCQSTSTQRSSVERDPPHFEFRGTPAQARAISEFNGRNDPSPGTSTEPGPDTSTDPRVGCFDTITDAGRPLEQCIATGVPAAGWRLPVATDAPDGAVAAMINLTAVAPAHAGFLTLEDCGPIEVRDTSAVNFGAGETAAAMAVVPLDADGRFCVFRSTAVHSVVDVVGFLSGTGERLWFDPSTPRRLVDTRIDGDGTSVADETTRAVPTADPAPRVANLTVVRSTAPGHAQAGSCTTVGASEFSNINYVKNTTRANMVLLDNGDDGACVWAYRETHVVVDEFGRLLPDDGLGWRIAPPRRALDTRRCSDEWCDGQPADGEAFAVDLGIDSPAAAVTVTIDRATAPGHAWVGACNELVDGEPPTSNVNYVPGTATANMAIIAPDDGEVCVYVHAAADVIIDVRAELVEDHTIGLVPIAPRRVHDSRQS